MSRLGKLLRPSSIVFVGGRHVAASVRTCRRAGFDGRAYVVNPVRDAIEGIACAPDVAALPEVPDAALVALSPSRSVEAVRALAEAGVGGAVVMTSGFRETGAEGAALEDALVAAAGDMALIGPNCLGVLNQLDGAAVLGDDLPAGRIDGPACAIVSQSGAFLIGIASVETAFPLGYAISVGNQAQTDHAACIEALLDDPRVTAIGLYVEGIRDGAALGRACWRAAAQGVPVVALKGGDGAHGAAVAQSHTAALVVERRVWDAFVARYGLVEVSSLKALVETLKLLCVAGVPAGPRATVVSFSGGLNGQVAARASALGLALPAPDADRAAALRAALPSTIAVGNPLDMNLPYTSSHGASLEDAGAMADIICEIARGVADQVAFFLDIPRRGPDRLDAPWLPALDAMAEVKARLGLPASVASILPEGLEPHVRQGLLAGGIAPLCGASEALEAMGLAARLSALEAGRGACPPLLGAGPAGPVTALDEDRAKALLGPYGIGVPDRRVVAPSDAARAAAEIGGRVAVKVLSADLLHKAAVGGVALDVAPDEVAGAVQAMEERLAASGHALTRVLVEAMVPAPAQEVLLGVKSCGALGLAMILGPGGADVEARDHALRLLPLQRGALQSALAEVGLAEVPAVLDAAEAFAAFALDHAGRLHAAEINPLIVTQDGRALAADAVVQLIQQNGEPA